MRPDRDAPSRCEPPAASRLAPHGARRLRLPHRAAPPDRDARAGLRAIADGDGLIGDIQTISIGAERSIRDVSVEVRDIDQAHRLAEIIASIDEVRVIDHHDRAIDRHVGGKIEVVPRIAIASLQDLRDVYVPGVARVCRAIAADPAQANRFTWVGRTVAICTNGTRVLGLGRHRPAGLDAGHGGQGRPLRPVHRPQRGPDPHRHRQIPTSSSRRCCGIAPSFGAIHLEDIRVPECFEIERELDRRSTSRSCTTTCTARRSPRWPHHQRVRAARAAARRPDDRAGRARRGRLRHRPPGPGRRGEGRRRDRPRPARPGPRRRQRHRDRRLRDRHGPTPTSSSRRPGGRG